jgi:hypothetical protein
VHIGRTVTLAKVHQANAITDEAGLCRKSLARRLRPFSYFCVQTGRSVSSMLRALLKQRGPGCVAALCAGEFLRRYHGALDSAAEKADDDQNIDHDDFSTVELNRDAAYR